MKRRAASTATSPMGTLMKRIHCQPSASVSTPPTSAPAAPPAAPIAAHAESARLRSAPSVKVVVRMDSVAGATTAPPRPWKPRATINWPWPCDRPPASEAAANRNSPAIRTFLWPSRSAARPPSSRKPAKVIVYALTTHWRSTTEKPRSLRIEGSATFTTETSRITMNCARQQMIRVQRLVASSSDCTGNYGSGERARSAGLPGRRRLDDPDRVAIGVRDREHRRRAAHVHRRRGDRDALGGREPLELGAHVGGLDADRAAAGLVPHRRVEGEACRRTGRGDLEPAHLAVLAEAVVASHLPPELVGVEGQ